MAENPRHFIDLSATPANELRSMLDNARAMKQALKAGKPESRWQARSWR